ncbi:diacylglycerol kinase [Kitasatospora phosalacinea]|uniref:Diacylglycerol kinase n=1 Tax=Kitasatospora phosalacinea TaxID=2065 RepID=A0A9W6UPI9_9ACTN|nr:diacylglycerol kinase [Kitasatospora phosalacinea]GLW54615.1 diacylglycerol kinase [Kitasatospora phosalacinea]
MSSLSTPVSRPPDDTGGPEPLLVLLDPSAREADGESVRIAKDVLCGGADVKVALPESPSELDRVLAHRGRRRAVVIGSDQALQRVLQALHRQRELDAGPVGLVPVGGPVATATARLLGVPAEPVAAARAVLGGAARRLDLLLDDGGGVVLAEVRFTGPRQGRTGGWRSLWAKLAAAEQASPTDPEELRIEADGRLLVDVHQRVRHLRVAMVDGAMELALDLDGRPQRHRAVLLTVVGRDFGYEADGCPVGPVRHRTWTVRPASWRLLLPAA